METLLYWINWNIFGNLITIYCSFLENINHLYRQLLKLILGLVNIEQLKIIIPDSHSLLEGIETFQGENIDINEYFQNGKINIVS